MVQLSMPIFRKRDPGLHSRRQSKTRFSWRSIAGESLEIDIWKQFALGKSRSACRSGDRRLLTYSARLVKNLSSRGKTPASERVWASRSDCILWMIGDRGRDTAWRGTTRTNPGGRWLAHPVLISDGWRRSVLAPQCAKV